MGEKIPLSEAAKLVNKNPATIRRLCNDGKIPSSKNSQGRHVIERNDLLAYYAISARTETNATDKKSDREADLLRDQIASMKETIDREREENRELRQQILRLESELFKITAELQTFLSRETGTSPSAWRRESNEKDKRGFFSRR